jgi:hypothetical protein
MLIVNIALQVFFGDCQITASIARLRRYGRGAPRIVRAGRARLTLDMLAENRAPPPCLKCGQGELARRALAHIRDADRGG